MSDDTALPLTKVNSFSRFVVLDGKEQLVSEHESTPDAVQALAKYAQEKKDFAAAVYRRAKTEWVRY